MGTDPLFHNATVRPTEWVDVAACRLGVYTSRRGRARVQETRSGRASGVGVHKRWVVGRAVHRGGGYVHGVYIGDEARNLGS